MERSRPAAGRPSRPCLSTGAPMWLMPSLSDPRLSLVVWGGPAAGPQAGASVISPCRGAACLGRVWHKTLVLTCLGRRYCGRDELLSLPRTTRHAAAAPLPSSPRGRPLMAAMQISVDVPSKRWTRGPVSPFRRADAASPCPVVGRDGD